MACKPLTDVRARATVQDDRIHAYLSKYIGEFFLKRGLEKGAKYVHQYVL